MIDQIFELREQWVAAQSLLEENRVALWQWIRMQFNHHSNHFEGNTLTYSETQLLLIHGRTEGDHELREYEEMKAHDVAFEYIRQLAKEERHIGEGDIRDLNQICLKEPFFKTAITSDGEPTQKEIIPGEYKKLPNHVRTKTGEIFRFATPEETPAMMTELVAWIQDWLDKETDHQLQTLIPFLAELHKRFIRIHPFDDGNGRVVRLIINYILIRLDFLPMVLRDRDKYIKAIQSSDVGNMSQLEDLFASAIVATLEKGIHAKDHRIDLNGDDA